MASLTCVGVNTQMCLDGAGKVQLLQGMNRRHALAAVGSTFLLKTTSAKAMELAGGCSVELLLDEAIKGDLKALVMRWIEKSAEAVVVYYGKFPVPELQLAIGAGDGHGVQGGRSEPGNPPRIETKVGHSSTEQHLLVDDWVLVHEMIHQAIPYVSRQHFWVAEGLAVYVESIARVQAGHLSAAQIWRDFLRQMPRGIAPETDKGLDFTRNHSRVYWGGAVFFMLADVRIRDQSGNRIGLQHALRAVNAKMDFRQEADVPKILKAGDAATGMTVLMDLYNEMAMKPMMPDLERLWADLGVRPAGDTVVFDDSAPLAACRKAILQKIGQA
jgi:hypothetical protein